MTYVRTITIVLLSVRILKMSSLIICLRFTIIFLFFLILPIYSDHAPPRYTVNLDLPAIQRWSHITEAYRHYAPEVVKMIDIFIPAFLRRPLAYIGRRLMAFLPEDTSMELQSIATITGIDAGDITIINLIYDFTASKRKACTSIVAQDAAGQIWHGRNLDYAMMSLLKNLTILVDFQRRNQTVYTGVSFAFYTGLLTGQKPGKFGISLNERFSGFWIDNIVMALFTRMKHPLSFAVRKVLEDANSFTEAVHYMSTIQLIAPCYLIISGPNRGEGAVISRNRWGTADIWLLESYGDRWYLLETNWDHWKPAGDDRREVGERLMNATGSHGINAQTMFDVLSTNPVQNTHTIYTTVISPAYPHLIYNTTVVRDP